jgi:hypothetical protein
MENNVKLADFMDLYNQIYPSNPAISPVISEVVQADISIPAPASHSGSNKGKFGRNIMIVAVLGLAIYGVFKIYEKYQAKKDKRT